MEIESYEERRLSRFLRGARIFAVAAIIAGAFILALNMVQVALTKWISTPKVVTPEAERLGGLKYALDAVTQLVTAGAVSAVLLICGGVVLLILLRIARSQEAGAISAPLDEAFVRRATIFALVVRVYAWVYLVFTVGGTVVKLVTALARSGEVFSGQRITMGFFLLGGLSEMMKGVIYFFFLTLISYVIGAMLLLAHKNERPEGAPHE
jgi:hypothetical protein